MSMTWTVPASSMSAFLGLDLSFGRQRETRSQSRRLGLCTCQAARSCCCFAKAPPGPRPVLPGGRPPPQDGSGRLHLAFAIPASELEAWRDRLQPHGVPIEGEVKGPRGGTSLYFRDPDGHLVELATPGLWST